MAVSNASILESELEVLPLGDAQTMARFFQILADPTRIRIVKALAEGEWCVSDLVQALKMDQPAVSHQLKYLRDNQLVSYRKNGRHVYYQLSDEHVRTILFAGLDHIIQHPLED